MAKKFTKLSKPVLFRHAGSGPVVRIHRQIGIVGKNNNLPA